MTYQPDRGPCERCETETAYRVRVGGRRRLLCERCYKIVSRNEGKDY